MTRLATVRLTPNQRLTLKSPKMNFKPDDALYVELVLVCCLDAAALVRHYCRSPGFRDKRLGDRFDGFPYVPDDVC